MKKKYGSTIPIILFTLAFTFGLNANVQKFNRSKKGVIALRSFKSNTYKVAITDKQINH